MFTLLAVSDTSIGVCLSLVLTGLVVAMARMIHMEDYRWKNLFVEILKLQKAAGVEKAPSLYVTPLDRQILDKGKSRLTTEQWAELMKSNGAKNGTGKNDTNQAPAGAATLPGGTAPYYSTACEEASRACSRYDPGYCFHIEREGNGYRWRLIAPASKVESPRLNRSGDWDRTGELEDLRHIAHLIGTIYYHGNFKAETPNEAELEGLLLKRGYRYHSVDEMPQVMISRGGGSTPEPFAPKRTLDARSYMSCKAGEQPTEVIPTTQEEKEVMTSILCAEMSMFIKQAKEYGTLINVKHLSDGYHTFQELYDMRLALTVGMMRSIHAYNDRVRANCVKLWRSRLHKDSTMFDGMFIVGMSDVPGDMITFHYHNEHWDKFNFCNTLDKAPEWDGHTDKDVIERLLAI